MRWTRNSRLKTVPTKISPRPHPKPHSSSLAMEMGREQDKMLRILSFSSSFGWWRFETYLTNHLVGVTKNGRTNIYILFAPKVKLKLSTRESNRPSYLHTSKRKDQAVLFPPSISHIQLLQRLSVYLFCLLN